MSKHTPFGMDEGTHAMCEKLFNEGRYVKAKVHVEGGKVFYENADSIIVVTNPNPKKNAAKK